MISFLSLFISQLIWASPLPSPTATFSESYKSEHRGTWSVETPEVFELVNIIMAITPEGISGEMLELHQILQKSDPEIVGYYRSVLNHFLPYSGEPIVGLFNKKLIGTQQGRFYAFTNLMSYTYQFVGDRLIQKGPHLFFDFDGTAHYTAEDEKAFKQLLPSLERFAKKTGYRQFYKEHENHYRNLSERYRSLVNVKRQVEWLEKRFPLRIDSYRIVISSLIDRFHTNGMNAVGDFSEALVTTNAPDKDAPSYWEERRTFTEIDEVYTKSTTDKWTAEISKVLGDKKNWASDDALKSYGVDNGVFTEYLTWALFLGYAKEHYSSADYENAKTRLIQTMVENRGFTKFKEFSAFMIDFFAKKPEAKAEEIYPEVLKWMTQAR